MIGPRPISGAIRLITKMFSPTGGWIRPISITTAITTPNHTRSNPAARNGGSTIGAVIRMIDTGGRKNPSTTTRNSTAVSSRYFDRCSATIHCAAPWLMCRKLIT